MFNRPKNTYEVSYDAIDAILRDEASPLNLIARLIPDGATVLDVGAGNGLLGQVLKGLNKDVLIDGIEPSEYAADIARPFYRCIYVGLADQYLDAIREGNYDYLVLADVVEHTVNPHIFLSEINAYLSPSTKLLISLPNVAFGGQRLSLLNGSFNYINSGLLEKTHLRFFTLESAKKLFSSIPLSCASITFLNRSFYRVEFSGKELKASLLQLFKLAFSPDARAYQYIFQLHKGVEANTSTFSSGVGSASIMIDIILNKFHLRKIAIFCSNIICRK